MKYIATIFEDSLWTYIEPNAGVISACLPFLAKAIGQKVLKWLKDLSTFGNKTTSLLRFRSKTGHSTKDSSSAKPGTARALHEDYDLSDHHFKGIMVDKDRETSEESIRRLV